MFKIQRSADAKFVVFTLSGRLKATGLAELKRLLECEADGHNLVLDLNELKLVDRDTISFLVDCETRGVKLTNCPAYIREWIQKEAAQKGS
jgi:anti-anti-sigma regulatory factor